MENSLIESVLKVCAILNAKSVEYLVVGGTSVALHALDELGLDVTEFKEEIAPNPKKSFFRFEREDFKIDFLPEIPGLPKFRISFNNRVVSKILDIEVPYISYDDLIASKKILGRAKDLEDIEQLRLRKNNSEQKD